MTTTQKRLLVFTVAVIAICITCIGVTAANLSRRAAEERNTDAAFATVVTDAGIPESAVPGAKQVALGLCEDLDDGIPYSTALAAALDYTRGSSVTPEMVGAIHGAGVAAYCPDHTGDIR